MVARNNFKSRVAIHWHKKDEDIGVTLILYPCFALKVPRTGISKEQKFNAIAPLTSHSTNKPSWATLQVPKGYMQLPKHEQSEHAAYAAATGLGIHWRRNTAETLYIHSGLNLLHLAPSLLPS